MWSWLDVQSTMIDDIIAHDGLGDAQTDLCSLCLNCQLAPLYHCLEFFYSSLFCGECIIKLHKALPLHHLEVQLSLSPSHHTQITHSAARMGFSTRPLYIHLDLSVTLGMKVMPVPWTCNPKPSSLSTSTVGTNYKSNSAPVGQVPHGTNAIVN